MADADRERLEALLARLTADAAELAAVPLGGLDGVAAATAHRAVREVRDRLGLVSAGLLARVEADGRWAVSGGARDVPQWAAQREGVSYGTARREVTLGRALGGELPATRDAVASGRITLEHATVLAELGPTSPARRAALASDLPDRNEEFLLAKARRLGVDDFRKDVRRWAAAVDDEAAEREHTQAKGREYLTLGRRRDGVALSGFLTHEHGELVSTALRAVAGVPAKDDERTTDQRMAAALADASRLVLDRGLVGQGALVRPHLSVQVSYETLRHLEDRAAARELAEGAGGTDADAARSMHGSRRASTGLEPVLVDPAELESGEPIPRSTLERLVCDSEISRIVFGPEGDVLDVGRATRPFSKQLRRAVIARDRHCCYPGCSSPPTLAEVHHIRWWSRGGDTSVVNGVLLCWHHHDVVHERDLRITRVPHGWEFTRRDGRPLRAPGRGSPAEALGPPPATRSPVATSPATRSPVATSPPVGVPPDEPRTDESPPEAVGTNDPPEGPDLLDMLSA